MFMHPDAHVLPMYTHIHVDVSDVDVSKASFFKAICLCQKFASSPYCTFVDPTYAMQSAAGTVGSLRR